MHHSKLATVRLFPRSNVKVRRSILRLHNKYRASVVPPASNMLRMVNMIYIYHSLSPKAKSPW